jgi:putative transposase
MSIGRACKIVSLSRSMFYYTSKKDDSEVESKLLALAEQKPTRGLDHYTGLIRNEGIPWNHKRIGRVYKKLGLNIRRKRKRRVPRREKEPLTIPPAMNQSWSMDFMHDSLESGRKVKFLNIIDDYNREVLTIDTASSITGERLKEVLTQIIEWRGKPEEIRTDNGPEFLSAPYVQFCESNGIRIKYIQPGKPVQNALIERFNRTFREDVLDAYIFEDMEQVREISEKWVEEYNENHPHQSLGGISPRKYLMKNKEKSNSELS